MKSKSIGSAPARGPLIAYDRVVGLHVLAEEVRAVDLDAVVDPRRGQHAFVPLGDAQHAAHVVGQRLVARAVVRRIVAHRELAERRREAADANVHLVGDAKSKYAMPTSTP